MLKTKLNISNTGLTLLHKGDRVKVSKGAILAQKDRKNADISKIKRNLVLTCQVLGFSHNTNEF